MFGKWHDGNGSPLQYSCLENPRDGGACWVPSMGSHRVGHDWRDLAAAAAAAAVQSKPLLLFRCPVVPNSFATPWIGIFQAILEWVAILFSRASSWPKGPNFHLLLLLLCCRQILYHWATGEKASIDNGNANSSCGDYWESRGPWGPLNW